MSGSPSKTGGMMKHPSLGELFYSTVYFAVETPVLFTCYFNESDEKYVGVKVEDFVTDGKRVESWYFVGVLDNEIKMLETTPGKLKEIFNTRPVIWCNRHGDTYTWRKNNGIAEFYQFNEDATLS